MYKPHTIEQYKVYRFLEENFALEHFLLAPLSRFGLIMVVVSLIAVVITKITIVNIEMKEVERGTKKNFYSADELMDNLRAGARELAEQSLEKAYADVLENYLTYSASGGDVQKVFATRYMDGLQKQFAENHTDPAVGASDTMDASGNVAYRVSGYDTDTVKSCIKEAADQGCYIPAADPKYEVDYGAGTFTLKGVQIRYKDAQDYETTIKTDLVFSCASSFYRYAHPLTYTSPRPNPLWICGRDITSLVCGFFDAAFYRIRIIAGNPVCHIAGSVHGIRRTNCRICVVFCKLLLQPVHISGGKYFLHVPSGSRIRQVIFKDIRIRFLQ